MEYKYNREDLKKTLAVLRDGGLILYPTDTIWGIGCDATNEEAVQKVFALKQREDAKSLLLLVETSGRLPSYVDKVPDVAWDLMEMSEKPVSIIYDHAKNLAPSVVAEDGSVGIRVCNEPFVRALLQQFKKPIVSTSANISGENAPAFFNEISEEIKTGVDYVVEYRQDDITKSFSSSIIKLGASGTVKVIRE
ncbi:translation factor SUA5 [Balneicella halophila]|uniref:L-threonylcarbamoyladenylate synthase n=1 Tax=Balneicella halophila TaxID=1537566 RepID=A0A7L4US29_BALHA|nr:L-threonylcarbamoyladenylate synthase [Balneicella halophila]PVX52588.1 translation factor SUA5 [Balneicella halophila]